MIWPFIAALFAVQDAPPERSAADMMPVQATAPVQVTLTEVRAAPGPIYVMLQSRGQFMTGGGTATGMVETAVDGENKVTLQAPAGEYSLLIWHDIDNDREFDRDERGMPLDGWGMSIEGALQGAPTFDAASFTVPDQGASVAVMVHYPNPALDPAQAQ